jgi:hypothetical protein
MKWMADPSDFDLVRRCRAEMAPLTPPRVADARGLAVDGQEPQEGDPAGSADARQGSEPDDSTERERRGS